MHFLQPLLVAAAARGAMAAAPAVAFATGFNNSDCEAHPHAGVELADGGWLLVGDTVCWDGSAPYDRAVFVVVAESDGAQRWTTVLGDVGFNYGKYGAQLSDGSLLIAGVKSVVDDEAKDYAYIEKRALWRLDVDDGSLMAEHVFENKGKQEGLRDGAARRGNHKLVGCPSTRVEDVKLPLTRVEEVGCPSARVEEV